MALNLQQRWRSFLHTARDLILNTHAEAGFGAAAFIVMGLLVGHNRNMEKAQIRPVAMAEFGKTVQAYAKAGKTVGALTRIHARCSDPTMKVNEAYNYAVERDGGSDRAFATELEFKTSRDIKVHRLIGEDAAVIQQDAQEALQTLAPYAAANAALPAISSAFGRSWSYDRDDYYEEYQCGTECDEKGENCEPVMCERYDYSIHKYYYDRQAGEQASRLLGGYLERTPSLKIDERLILSTRTDPDNEYAIERTFREVLGNKIPTTAQVLGIANRFATGNNFVMLEQSINDTQARLGPVSIDWQHAYRSAQSTRYRTESQSDDGPREYQIAQRALNLTSRLNEMTSKVTGGIAYCAYAIPEMNAAINRYIDGKLNGNKAINVKEERKKIFKFSETSYNGAFMNGHELNRYNAGEVLILGFVAGLLGGALGLGVSHGIDYYRRRKHQTNSLH